MAIIILKFEQCSFTIEYCVQEIQTLWQIVLTLIRLFLQQSDLGLHCLPRPVCLKAWDHNSV